MWRSGTRPHFPRLRWCRIAAAHLSWTSRDAAAKPKFGVNGRGGARQEISMLIYNRSPQTYTLSVAYLLSYVLHLLLQQFVPLTEGFVFLQQRLADASRQL